MHQAKEVLFQLMQEQPEGSNVRMFTKIIETMTSDTKNIELTDEKVKVLTAWINRDSQEPYGKQMRISATIATWLNSLAT